MVTDENSMQRRRPETTEDIVHRRAAAKGSRVAGESKETQKWTRVTGISRWRRTKWGGNGRCEHGLTMGWSEEGSNGWEWRDMVLVEARMGWG
ncbi:hypothetical protein E2C01_092897 [Portunus trituberculatus]|uniref:Uncharacterized protein n=1 Tax=Portunus trituberculatus TaxID=210409 RepID=A0A5B7JWQ5_PORTR|nr:hypothetical protein [Portunus trituberculatus]